VGGGGLALVRRKRGVERPRPPLNRLTSPWLTPAVRATCSWESPTNSRTRRACFPSPLIQLDQSSWAPDPMPSPAMGASSSRAREGLSIQKRDSPLQEVPRYHDPLDLAGAFVDLQQLCVAHELLDEILLHVAVAAEDL